MTATTDPAVEPGNLQKLDELTHRCKALKRDVAELKKAQLLIPAEIDRRVGALSGLSPTHFIVAPKAGTVDKATEKSLAEIAMLRGRLEVLPGAVFETTKRLAECERAITQLCDAEWQQLRDDARERMRAERAQLYLDLADRCGRDAARLNSAVDAIMVASEVTRWLKDFPLAALHTEPLARARCIKRCREFFDAGKTLSAAFKE